jgi:hypothetical protein
MRAPGDFVRAGAGHRGAGKTSALACPEPNRLLSTEPRKVGRPYRASESLDDSTVIA